jgi:hypothetical protein
MRQNDGPAGGRAKISIQSREILHKSVKKSTLGIRANTRMISAEISDFSCKTPVVAANAGTQRRSGKVTGSPPSRGRRSIGHAFPRRPTIRRHGLRARAWRGFARSRRRDHSNGGTAVPCLFVVRGGDRWIASHLVSAAPRQRAQGHPRSSPRRSAVVRGNPVTRIAVAPKAAECPTTPARPRDARPQPRRAAARVRFIARHATWFRESAGSSRAS